MMSLYRYTVYSTGREQRHKPADVRVMLDESHPLLLLSLVYYNIITV